MVLTSALQATETVNLVQHLPGILTCSTAIHLCFCLGYHKVGPLTLKASVLKASLRYGISSSPMHSFCLVIVLVLFYVISPPLIKKGCRFFFGPKPPITPVSVARLNRWFGIAF